MRQKYSVVEIIVNMQEKSRFLNVKYFIFSPLRQLKLKHRTALKNIISLLNKCAVCAHNMNMLKRNFQAPYVIPILRIHHFVKNIKNFQITSSHLAVLHCMTLNVSVSTAQGRVVRRPG